MNGLRRSPPPPTYADAESYEAGYASGLKARAEMTYAGRDASPFSQWLGGAAEAPIAEVSYENRYEDYCSIYDAKRDNRRRSKRRRFVTSSLIISTHNSRLHKHR
jgi:hypothetical protein